VQILHPLYSFEKEMSFVIYLIIYGHIFF